MKSYQDRTFTLSDYLDGTFWFYIPNERRYPLHPDHVNTKETALMYDGWKPFTQDKIGDFLFITTLQAIDAARDTRLVTQLFIKRDGNLGGALEEETFAQILEEELTLLYGDKQHRTQKRVSQGSPIRAHLVMNTTEEYIQKNYGLEATWRLFKFFTETDWQTVEDKYKQFIGRAIEFFDKQFGAGFKPGYWLQLQTAIIDKVK